MKCFIRRVNGETTSYSMYAEDNLKQIFPGIDLTNHPEWVPVRKTEVPPIYSFQKLNGPPKFEFVNNEYIEMYEVRSMSRDEKDELIRILKENWEIAIQRGDGFKSWVFVETENGCGYMPPIPDPSKDDPNRKSYSWDEENKKWIWKEGMYW